MLNYKLFAMNMFYSFALRPGNENIPLPLQENVGYQSATAALLFQRNLAYGIKEDMHTYDYIQAEGMILTRVDLSPPKLPPDRKVQVQDANNEGKN